MTRPTVAKHGVQVGFGERDIVSADSRGDQGHLMIEECIASESEKIRAIVSAYSPCLVMTVGPRHFVHWNARR